MALLFPLISKMKTFDRKKKLVKKRTEIKTIAQPPKLGLVHEYIDLKR
jgi:hypothetical protein